MRVVLDTNTIISALFWEGPPSKVFIAATNREFVLISSEPLLAELSEVLQRPKFVPALTAIKKSSDALIAEYRELAEFVESVDVPSDVIRDPKDRAILACAVGGKADYIVSGDKDLLVLGRYENVSIVNAEQFLRSFRTGQ